MLALLLCGSLAAQCPVDVEEPWEPLDAQGAPSATVEPLRETGMFADIGLAAIGYYQRRISPSSVSRCPFAISCSHFAAIAIRDKGFLPGVCCFIDRNLYREHAAIYRYYPLVVMPDGALKLDDRYYLYGK